MRYRITNAASLTTTIDDDGQSKLVTYDLEEGEYVQLVSKGVGSWKFRRRNGEALILTPPQIEALLEAAPEPFVVAPDEKKDDKKHGKLAPTSSGKLTAISHPADYSGDAWHLAGAMAVCGDVRCVITAQSTDAKSKDVKESTKFVKFYTDAGLLKQVLDARSQVFVVGDGGSTAAEKHRWPVLQHCKKASSVVSAQAGTVYTSTSVIIAAIMKFGVDEVTSALRRRFCGGYDNVRVRAAVQRLTSRKSAYVIVSMRSAGYNEQHDVNEHIYKEILAAAPGGAVVPVGNAGACGWLAETDARGARDAIDPFDFGRDMRDVSLFWSMLAEANLEVMRLVVSNFKGFAKSNEKDAQKLALDTEAGKLLKAIRKKNAEKKVPVPLTSDEKLAIAKHVGASEKLAPTDGDAAFLAALQKVLQAYAKNVLYKSNRATWLELLDGAPLCQAVIGGRSGSLDIAAFMGMRTICWDIHDPKDPEYVRLHLAAPLMSVIGFDCSPAHVCSAKNNWRFRALRSIDPEVSFYRDASTDLADILREILPLMIPVVPAGGVNPDTLASLLAPNLGVSFDELVKYFDSLGTPSSG